MSTFFPGDPLTKTGEEDILCGCEVNRRLQAFGHEESPGTAEQGCRLTAGGGDSRESATEINRPDPQREPGKDGKARQELTRGTGNFSAL